MKLKIVLLLIVLTCFVPANAQQTSTPSSNNPTSEDLQKRLTQMEAEMKEMREELARIKTSGSGPGQLVPLCLCAQL